MRERAIKIVAASFMLTVFRMATPGSPLFAQLKPKLSSAVAIPDTPRITEFSANPAIVVKGRNTLLRWRVEPGPAGSPIVSVNIVKTEGSGPSLSIRSGDLTGEHGISTLSSTPEGKSTYALTAVNKAGLSATKTVSLEITGPPDLVVKDISSLGLGVGFSITNIGRGNFRGKLTLSVSVNESPGAIRPDRFREISKLADGLYEVRDIQIAPSVESRFGLLDPESRADGWYSGTYAIFVKISTDNIDENSRNNEKRVALTHSGLRRGTPTFDLYILGPPRLSGVPGSNVRKKVNFTVFNTGPTEANNIDWEARILDTDQARRGESGLLIKTGTIGRLAPGRIDVSFEQDFSVAVDHPLLLRVRIDPEDKIFEKDETNNKQELAFVIH